jgi:hypothetical protein
MRELFNVILLLLNMHGMVQRERLVRLYSSRGALVALAREGWPIMAATTIQ